MEDFKIREIEKLKKIKEKKDLRAMYEQGTVWKNSTKIKHKFSLY